MSAASHDAHAEVQEIGLDERETNTPRPNSNSPSRNTWVVVLLRVRVRGAGEAAKGVARSSLPCAANDVRRIRKR
jgi:hypothetical protein